MKYWIIFISLSILNVIAVPAFADLGSIIQTLEGVESDVKGSALEVGKHTLKAFKDLQIQITGVDIEQSGAEQTLKGKKGEVEVITHVKKVSPEITHVTVTAKQGTLNWNKEFAQEVLSKIIKES